MAQGTGRIIQHNAMVGEALGIAAVFAARSGWPLPEVAGIGLPPIRDILASRLGRRIEITGQAAMPPEEIDASKVLKADRRALETLRQSVAETSGIL